MDFCLESERLTLRKLSIEYLEKYHDIFSDESILDMHIGVDYPISIDLTRLRIEILSELHSKGLGYFWCLFVKESSELVGSISLSQVDKRHKRAELSYWIGIDYRGRGYMSEAVFSVIEWAFNNLDLERIYSMCFVNNADSKRVLENMGMRYEGTFRNEYFKNRNFVDLHHYAILRADWYNDRHSRPKLFETERLILRQLVRGDAEAISKAFNHKEILDKTTHISYPYELKNAKDFIQKTISESQSGKGFYFAIIDRLSGNLIGEVHIMGIRPKYGICELGFGLNPKYWNLGYATEASKEMIRFAFEDLGLRRIHSMTMDSNIASRSVLERTGFKFEGLCREQFMQRDKPVSFAHYGLLKKEWK